MAMTEPQGGSDLSRSSTQATARGDGTFTLNGHKWFVSHPTADAFLILARDPEVSATGNDGLSCFLASGWREDGSRNGFELQRLKDKLGTRSLASAEVILRDTYATRVGEPGRGIATIIEMVVHTRMDCAIGSAGLMARAVAETVHYARKREAFGAVLEAQPQMRTVLADIVLEREASLALAYEVALQFQQGNAIGRLMTAVAKYWITRRAVAVAIECVESLGGNGYTEELPLARLYRDAQVNSTWEGAGNVMALDVLRTLTKQPQLMGELIAHVADLVADAPLQLARDVASLCADINPPTSQADGRRFAGEVAVTLQAALLAHRAGATGHDSDAHIARAFIATRCHGRGVHIFGANASALDEAADALIDRAPLPHAPAA
jgi:putative acyl-CoA dehydrogenase